jgi:N-acylneuraminate cytidylyltransferase
VVQLRPTSPVRPLALVDDAVKLLLAHPEADSVRGVVPAGQNPHKMWRIDPQSGQLRNLLDVSGVPEPYNAPRQILPPVYWQTGHIDVIRPATIVEQNSMSGRTILPVKIDPRFTVDLDNPSDWQRAEWLVWYGGLQMVYPGTRRRPLPATVKLVVFDFDGVMTDNRVWVDSEGHEFIAAYRSDSMGLRALHDAGIESLVLSTETDKAVEARCRKIGIEVIQGVHDKAERLKNYLTEHEIDPSQVVYVGNDDNDLPCFSLVVCAVAVADAQQQVQREADQILSRSGGFGAVREMCERILKR